MSGKFTSTSFSGAGCSSPVGLCANSELHGDLHGTGVLVINSISPTRAFSGVLLDTTVMIHDHRGDLTCGEALPYNPSPAGASEFAGRCELISGTGHRKGATGYLPLTGTFPPGQPNAT